jgi:type II restriction/modification system DNA methylase subunit YeeA
MPFMFEAISDYTELLLPDDMLSPNSIRAVVVGAMPTEDCKDVEIIGWLYQYYIAEKKEKAMAKKSKYKTSEIPAVTQLFTPDWIVKYMVENTLGKLWILNNPTSALKSSMDYYIDNPEQDNDFLRIKSPEELTIFDPCCGSGHILTYAFDILVKIYEESGYNSSEIPFLILEKNLYGCDIDKRAATLAQFAMAMKARLYYRRFFKTTVKTNILELNDFGSEEFKDIKTFGSLLTPDTKNTFDDGVFGQNIPEYDLQIKLLTGKFHCVITNPPYMGGGGMNPLLGDFVKNRYPEAKSDLFSAFMIRNTELTLPQGQLGFMTPFVWMFISSYEKLRAFLIDEKTITSLIQLEYSAFDGATVPICTFTVENAYKPNYKGGYVRLSDFKGAENQGPKALEIIQAANKAGK